MSNSTLTSKISKIGVNNYATAFFKASFIIVTALAALSQAVNFGKNLEFTHEKFISIIYLIQAVFSFLIITLGDPAQKNWNPKKILKTVLLSEYFQKNIKKAYFENPLKKGKKERKKQFKKAERKVRNDLQQTIGSIHKWFSKDWILLWWSWFFLYSWLFLKSTFVNTADSEMIYLSMYFGFVSNFLNLLGAWFLYKLYLSVKYKTNNNSSEKDDWESTADLKSRQFLFIISILLGLELMLIFIHTTSIPENCFCEHSLFSVPFLAEIRPSTIFSLFNLINGIVVSVSLALFVGRFIDSHAIKIKGKDAILVCLYTYVALQALYPYISPFSACQEKGNIQNESFIIPGLIVVLTLTFKYILYNVVTFVFEEKSIIFYFIESRIGKEKQQKRHADFQQIWDDQQSNKAQTKCE